MVCMDSSLHIPMGIVYAIIPVCGVLIVFYCLCNIAGETAANHNEEEAA